MPRTPPASDADSPVARCPSIVVISSPSCMAAKNETGIHPPAIDVHRARAALAVIAPFFRSGEMQMLAQAIEQSGARIDPQVVFLAVHTQCDWKRVHRIRRWRLPFESLVAIRHTKAIRAHGRLRSRIRTSDYWRKVNVSTSWATRISGTGKRAPSFSQCPIHLPKSPAGRRRACSGARRPRRSFPGR